MPSPAEIQRRYANLQTAMERDRMDALIVCGNQYAGFEGAVRYVSGFEIVHRYAYVVLPLVGEPVLVFPKEARWIGDKKKPWVREHVWPDVPGEWIRNQAQQKRWKRVAVYGLDLTMAVRDYRALASGAFELVPWDLPFDLARAVKSDEEMAAMRDSADIVMEGFWELVQAYEPGKTEAEIMAPAVERYFARGAGPRMMNIVLSGSGGEAEASFKVPGHRVVQTDDLLLYSLEITGADGYWIEFSRALIRGKLSPRTESMRAAYPEAMETGRRLLREGELASTVHRAVADVFVAHGFSLGHLSGHAIGTTMLELPNLGAGSDIELREGMTFSLHPQVVDQGGEVCLYTQDTYRVGKREGESLTDVPWHVFEGGEQRSEFQPSKSISTPVSKDGR
jgi:Xaa-Pro aminopeptidase